MFLKFSFCCSSFWPKRNFFSWIIKFLFLKYFNGGSQKYDISFVFTPIENIIAEHQKANRNSLDSDSNTDTDEPTAERAFLVRNDIKLFQNESNANNNNPNPYMIIDRRRSDTDALNAMSDVKLVRQKLLKYAHVKSQDSTEIENQDSKTHQTQNNVLNNNTRTSKETVDELENLKIEDAE